VSLYFLEKSFLSWTASVEATREIPRIETPREAMALVGLVMGDQRINVNVKTEH